MFSDKLSNVLARGFVVWLLIIFAETIHGTARRLLLEPLLGDFTARQVSVFTGAIIILAITLILVRWLKASHPSHFLLVGLMWVGLTVGFEVFLGRIAMDLSWERIMSDYDLTSGGLMLIGLVIMLIAPLAAAKLYDEV